MSWYYAGPDGKPSGPISLEELQARRAAGTITPETYVIEHTGQPNEQRAWKRFQELFPSLPVLPPAFIPPPAPTPSLTAPAMPHPLFPSAAPIPNQGSVFTSPAGPDPYYKTHRTNQWCLWGFGLGLGSLVLLPICGLGILMAPVALVLSVLGLVQVHQRPEESGKGLAISGLLLSGLVLLIAVIVLIWALPAMIKQHEQTTTEQSTSDSE